MFLGRHAGAAIVAFGATAVQPNNAKAATTPTPAELEKLRKGHSRIKFLLENWDSETQVSILRVFVIDSVTQIHPSYLEQTLNNSGLRKIDYVGDGEEANYQDRR